MVQISIDKIEDKISTFSIYVLIKNKNNNILRKHKLL